MKSILFSAFVIVAIFSLTGCDNSQENVQSIWADGTGALNLKVPTTESEMEIPIIYTKSGEDISFGMDPEAFPVFIYNDKTSLVKEFESFTALKIAGTPLVLSIGNYTVKACSYKPTTNVSDKPYFEGTSTFQIEEKKVLNTSVLCTFQSLGVELRLSDRFVQLLNEEPGNYNYTVVVSNDTDRWTFDKKNMKPGYFFKGCDRLTAKVVVKMGGQTYPERTWYFKNNENAPQLGEYYIITLDAGKNEVKVSSHKL